MRYLNDEDMKTVKKLIRGRMKGGIIFLLIITLVVGLIFFTCISGNSDSEPLTIFDYVKMGVVAILLYIVGIKFLILNTLKMYRRLSDGNYKIYKVEIYRCWRERFDKESFYRHFLEALYIGDDGYTKKFTARIDSDDYNLIKNYKYAYAIHFHKEDGKVKKYDDGVVIDTTTAGEHFFYKGTDAL